MEKLKDTGLGILCWGKYDTLRHSLDSHVSGNLLDMFDEKIIYFQEIDDEARAIAKEYGFEARGNDANTGIYGGFRGLTESMSSKYVLLLENDFCLNKSSSEAYRQLSSGLDLLESGRVIKVWYSDRHHPHFCRNCAKFHRYFPRSGFFVFRVLSFIYRLLNFPRVANMVSLSKFCLSRPQDYFDFIEYDEDLDFLIYPSRYHDWSNQTFLIKRTFFLNEILARAELSNTPRRHYINGFKNLENEVNISFWSLSLPYFLRRRRFSRSWWFQQDFKVATSESGIFTHDRQGYRGY